MSGVGELPTCSARTFQKPTRSARLRSGPHRQEKSIWRSWDLAGLSKEAQLVLISNATSRLLSDLRRLGIAEDFDYIINSSEVGFAKPDPNIYSAALDTVGAAPGQHLLRSPRYRGSNSGTGSVHRRQRRACGSGDEIGYSRIHLCWSRRSSAEAESPGASLITLNDF